MQRRHNCSPAASFANCVVTLYLLNVHRQTFLSIPTTQKCQILNCDTLVANERNILYRTIHCCRFQKACTAYGVPDVDLFQTVDLWDRKNIALVTVTIFAIGRTVSFIDFRNNRFSIAVSVMGILSRFFRPCILFMPLMFRTSFNDTLNNSSCIAHISYSVSCHIS
jgi:hypothetical protein